MWAVSVRAEEAEEAEEATKRAGRWATDDERPGTDTGMGAEMATISATGMRVARLRGRALAPASGCRAAATGIAATVLLFRVAIIGLPSLRPTLNPAYWPDSARSAHPAGYGNTQTTAVRAGATAGRPPSRQRSSIAGGPA